MQPIPPPAIEFAILGLLILANGLLTAAETAVVASRRERLRRMAEAGTKGPARALALAEQPARFLGLVQLWLTLSGIVAGVIAGTGLAEQAAAELARWPAAAPWARPAAFVLVTLGVTAFMLVFGELIPKRIALAKPERTASLLAAGVGAVARVLGPVIGVLGGTADAMVRAIGMRPRSAAESVGDEDVRALVEQGLHAGVFQRAEKEMVEGVLSLDQLRVTAIMTPRPKIVFLNMDDPDESNWRKIVTSGHSYFPVHQGNKDQVAGMVSVKALWAHAAIGLPATLKNLLVPPLVVPDTMMAIQVLEQFKKTGRHLAMVVDEFGAVEGLVTTIDIFEAIAGDLPEPGRKDGSGATRRDDGSWVVDATLPVAELKALLGTRGPLPQETEAEFKTAGGFAQTLLGRIPAPGDRFECAGWRFEVAGMDRRRVDRLVLSRIGGLPGGGADAAPAPRPGGAAGP